MITLNRKHNSIRKLLFNEISDHKSRLDRIEGGLLNIMSNIVPSPDDEVRAALVEVDLLKGPVGQVAVVVTPFAGLE